ncbi:MAG: M3 family metallopeptidase [Bacteroidales bacterium]|nr:M3 family metallopeptidase [Bacteroidales bacterium]
MPAFEKGFAQHEREIKVIAANKALPTFDNTIAALDYSGQLLHDVSAVFYTLTGSENTDELMALSTRISAMQTAHSNKISLNEPLFSRIKAVYDQRDALTLSVEQRKLLEDTYESFVMSGAALQGKDRETYKALSQRLSELSERFYQNSLKATNQYEKIITDEALLEGLPVDVKAAAKAKATAKKQEGWLFDLSAPVYTSLMKYLKNRDLREMFYRAYLTRATTGELDNKPVIAEMVNLRRERAQLLGSSTYAHHALKRRMAEKPEAVIRFLDQLSDAYLPTAKAELATIQGYATGLEGRYTKLEPWDLSYYSEKYKQARYNVSDEVLRPYFKLENVIDGVFGLATKLYGITFTKNTAIPTWNPEVDAWEVFDKDGSYLAVLYTDFHPRKGKRAGAWMSNFNEQYRLKGVDIRPHVSVTMNFTPSTDTKPSLLTYDEVTTFLHEFGHALHGIFSDVTYRGLSGTSVYRDFVELPSQVMENWASEKAFLDGFAKHYQTGEPIPAELIQKIKDAENYNVAMGCMRQLSFGYLDMAWHSLSEPFSGDVVAFEREAWKKAVILPQPDDCFMSATFSHLFSGGYAAGYYSYKWAEVLDADAYDWFVRKEVFDRETADTFRQHILSRGGTEHPMVLYKRFRGQEPSIDALLKRNGLR